MIINEGNLDLGIKKFRIVKIILNLFFLIIISRLWYLQIVKGTEFRQKSENNRLRRISIQSPRGLIFDRNGIELVKNRASFDIEIVLEDCPDLDGVLNKIAQISKIPFQELKERFDKLKIKRKKFEPRIILSDIDRDLLGKIAVHRYELPGVMITVKPRREYVYGETASHLLGYVREVTSEQLKEKNYKFGDIIGQAGIEKLEDNLIQGIPGIQEVTVNAVGTKISESVYSEEKPGSNINLTIDLKLQSILEEGLKNKNGAGIVMDSNTGEILAMASKPSFDPNIFTKSISQDVYEDLFLGSDRKMLNKTFQDTFAPGSIFKFIIAVAALSEGIINPTEKIKCNGSYQVGTGRPFHCHKRSGHGEVDLISAMKQSCNVYFYNLGQRLGIDRIKTYASLFGLGEKTELNLEGEKKGLIPSREWKKQEFSKPEDQIWYPGETPSVAIGQGAINLTLVQIARALSAFGNGGKLVKPEVIKAIRSFGDDSYTEEFQTQISDTIKIEPRIKDLVLNSLVSVVNDKDGTGKLASMQEFGIIVAGKTGTSQKASLDTKKGKIENAWFAGFAPAKKPEITVVILVEAGGHGGEAAAPIAKNIFKEFFHVN